MTRTLNTWLRAAAPVFRSHRGTIDKFLGDGVMALFGAFDDAREGPSAAAHARDAVEAAAALLDALKRFNEARALTPAPTFRIGIGIATGEAVVGNVGSEAKMDFTAIGRPVNLASRLEGTTKEFRWPLVVCDRTRRLLGEHVEAEARAGVEVRGLEGPVTAHLVRWVGTRPVDGW